MRPFDPRLLRYAGASRSFLVGATLLGLVRTACTIAFCWLLAQAVADAVGGRPLGGVAVALVVTVLVRALSMWAMDTAAASGAAAVKSQLRRRFVSTIAALGPSWLQRRNRAELTATAVVGLESLDGYFSLFLPQLVLTALATPLIVLTMYGADVLSGVIVTVTLPLIPVFMILIGWATQAAQDRQWATLTHLSSRFLDVVNGLATLKIFGREKRQEARIATITEDFRRATMKVLRLSFLSGFALELIATLSVAVVAVSVGLRLVSGSLGLATGLFVILLAPEAFLPLRQVGANYHAAADGVAAAKDVFAVLDDGSDARVAAAEPPVENAGPGRVEFSGVTVTLEGRIVFPPVDAVAEPGTITVIAGPSGSGKSTLFSALLGYTGFTGTISIDGRPAGRDRLAWSGQREGLLAGTVGRNVSLGDERPDPLMVRRSLTLAAASELDPDLPLGVAGAGLSGGQAERVCVARAIYRCLTRHCAVLMLDEPSAALDATTERELAEGLRLLADTGITVIVASHRPTIIGAADQIVTLREPHYV